MQTFITAADLKAAQQQCVGESELLSKQTGMRVDHQQRPTKHGDEGKQEI